ncbi:hypothetical protein CYMTET_12237 [Cymbomonas tetramitiformis]|uniref:Uncharacterized protein n=1 Tax=Cymbomonas tetramitiformis TaxID=36881 RepID=A0AAE0GKG3_9CHLO|nr:hypothetical protein CYMTET_12237 [Cymbomonas tetramitiformis]|eukprot:gene15385-18200_t
MPPKPAAKKPAAKGKKKGKATPEPPIVLAPPIPLVLIARLKLKLDAHTATVSTLFMGDFDKSTLYSAGSDNKIIFWDVQTMQPKLQLQGSTEYGGTLELAVTEQWYQPPPPVLPQPVEPPPPPPVYDSKGKLKKQKPPPKKKVKEPPPPPTPNPIQVLTLITTTSRGFLQVWQVVGLREYIDNSLLREYQLQYPVEGCEPPDELPPPSWACIHTISISSPNGTRYPANALAVQGSTAVYSGGRDHHLRRWDLNTWDCVADLEFSEGINKLHFHGENTLLAGCTDKKIRVVNTQTMEVTHVLTGHHGAVLTITSLQDGQFLSGSGDGTVKFWKLHDRGMPGVLGVWNCTKTLDNGVGVHSLLACGPCQIVVGGSDGAAKLWFWNVHKKNADWECARSITAESKGALGTLFAHDYSLLTAGSDRHIRVYR